MESLSTTQQFVQMQNYKLVGNNCKNKRDHSKWDQPRDNSIAGYVRVDREAGDKPNGPKRALAIWLGRPAEYRHQRGGHSSRSPASQTLRRPRRCGGPEHSAGQTIIVRGIYLGMATIIWQLSAAALVIFSLKSKVYIPISNIVYSAPVQNQHSPLNQ